MIWEKDIVDYWRQKSADTLIDARILFEKKRLFSCVNRIYYAVFYEVSALLRTENLSSPKHSGIKSLFFKHFIKTGIVDTEIGKFYSRIFDFRQEGDYDDFIRFEEEKVRSWLEQAEIYLHVLENLFDKK
ncbi:MAG: HEPN domain-containing protein [Candidatus Omnitrophota bacterium]